MGVHPHTLMFLRFASKRMRMGHVATMGRQGMFVPEAKLQAIIGHRARAAYGSYCEDLLMNELGAASVQSFDKSDYEGATHICDFNLPLTIEATYDFVFDGGFLEHIFNVPQALENMSALCAEGGQILHVLPANNVCGHGFWQFTPELFIELYCERNGYADTQVFLADVANEKEWYEVRKPVDGDSVLIVSSAPVWLLVRTKRMGQYSHRDVQQSRYVHEWNGNTLVKHDDSRPQRAARTAHSAKRGLAVAAARHLERKWQELLRPRMSLSASNPYLTKRSISALL